MKYVEMKARDITKEITITVTVDKAMREIQFRMKVALIFFRIGTWILGCGFEVEQGERR